MAHPFHEPPAELPPEAREVHRAIDSLIEELEAVMWYHGRAAVTDDPELKAIVEHNRDEEIEHAAMALEYLRRKFPQLDEELRTYLFTQAPITSIEEGEDENEDENDDADKGSGDGSLGIGSGQGG